MLWPRTGHRPAHSLHSLRSGARRIICTARADGVLEREGGAFVALDGDGDVLLVARLPLAVVDAGALDELFGELLTVADETFNTVLGTGFASYVEREQRWRELREQPDNPAFPTRSP